MIYLEPSQLGWEPLVSSWLNSLKGPLCEPEHQALLKGLFAWLIPPSLKQRKKKCKVILWFSELFKFLCFHSTWLSLKSQWLVEWITKTSLSRGIYYPLLILYCSSYSQITQGLNIFPLNYLCTTIVSEALQILITFCISNYFKYVPLKTHLYI